jgi:hypothetical protein
LDVEPAPDRATVPVQVDLARQRTDTFVVLSDDTIAAFVVTEIIGLAAPSAATGARIQTVNAAMSTRAAAR